MTEISVIVGIKNGIHARPSAKIAETVLKYPQTQAWIEDPQKNITSRADSIIELLVLGAVFGTEVIVKTDGAEEDKLSSEIEVILKNYVI